MHELSVLLHLLISIAHLRREVMTGLCSMCRRPVTRISQRDGKVGGGT